MQQLPLAEKILSDQRISEEEALLLFNDFDLPQLALLATHRKRFASQDKVFYNRNIHIEPTNICVYNCRFCSYRAKSDADSYTFTTEKIIENISAVADNITEVHITGGVHPEWGIYFFATLLKSLKTQFPHIHIKAFTAVEIAYMCNIDKLDIADGLRILKDAGLSSLPGGGAEIFDDSVREKISPEKPTGQLWLAVHRMAHKTGLPSNATMLFGHVESRTQRISHMAALRDLQDETHGFNCFIPLKFRNRDNRMSDIEETPVIEDLKTYAIARIFLDNIPHLKAYWPAVGRDFAQISLQFGVDDLDGTINDSTSIYTRAGSGESPDMSLSELQRLITEAGFQPVERDSVYNEL
ncbi:MAG: aminofutalosine synthase MqnE [Bacteroidetes bacterium GWF2_43_63]|nr:MAG: aminofutalosine synthase MqnE [Bacteroidetes bacterium GWE2_42_42]OFY54179.1 MAG: aminofutalosine synthase MqnE [Bacteroidetes bacterium GWF2_43_63]HBG70805.1 aminofutalosine synthase MqnE [Bacteroidales bacterium]HCB61709.1 aminofutalosine synthase MqnE [Bacteroidales bacterium]HCY22085.1 aminofutalosine synthase MqnE [Bacteroidales bacterium]